MRVRTFTVPFAKVAPDATELEFGPDDFLVVRPIFGLSQAESSAWVDRMDAVEQAGLALVQQPDETDEAFTKRKRSAAYTRAFTEAEDAATGLTLDLIRQTVVEWHLDGPDGPIPMPQTGAQLNALPVGVRTRLYPFLVRYRGEDPNPSTRS